MNRDQLIQTLNAKGYTLTDTTWAKSKTFETFGHATKPEVVMITVNGYSHIYSEISGDSL